MAKQTLKSLLGSSDERVQVRYDPSEITLAPTVEQTRGSGTVVQPMPQTTQALNFAKALNQVPQVLGQMKNIGQVQAKEDFSQMSAADRKAAMEDDKKISRWLGYDKTFQEELVKDYFVRNAQNMSQRFTSLAANPAAYVDDAAFDTALTEEKQALIGELQEEFGNNPNRVMAINAFGDKTMTEIIANTTEMYETNKISDIISFKATNLQKTLQAGGDIKIAAKTFVEDVTADANLSKSEAKSELLINMIAQANAYSTNGQYDKSLEIIDTLKNYEFFKGAKYAGKDLTTIVNAEDNVRTAKKNNDDVDTRGIATQIKNSFAFVSTTLAGYGKGEEVPTSAVNQVKDLITKLRPNIPDEQVDTLIAKFNDSELTSSQKVEQLKTILNEAGTLEFKGEDGAVIGVPDNTKTIFNLSAQGFVDYYSNEAVQRPWLVNGLTNIQQTNAVEGAVDWFKLPMNKYRKPKSYMEDIGFAGAKVPEGVQTAYEEAHQLDWTASNKTFAGFNENSLKVTLKNEFSNLRFFSPDKTKEAATKWSAFVDEYSDNYFPIIQQDLEDYSSTIIDDEKRDELLTKKVSELRNYYANNLAQLFESKTNYNDYLNFGYGRDANISRTGVAPSEFNFRADKPNTKEYGVGDFKKLDITTSSERFVEQSIKDETDIKQYPHLQLLRKRMFSEKYAYKNVEEFQSIYKNMRDNKDRNALQATMVAYGYPTYTPEAAEDLRKTGLSYAEVRLFGNIDELTEVSVAWQGAYNKATLGEILTEDEQKAFDALTDFGIFNSETFGQFMNVQKDLVEKY